MKFLETRIDTDATPDEVWAVLMDFPSYPNWNPMVVAIEGDAKHGEQLAVTIAMKNGRKMNFTPKVVEYVPGRLFGWLGKLGIPGIFDGVHRFEVEPNGTGTTFIHGEEFRGILPPVLGRVLRDTHEGLIAMNEALIQEVARRRVAVPTATP
jgi:hypothetical protein